MGREYSQLRLEERMEIARLSGEGASIRKIAAALDRAPSSIARELKRNTGAKVGYQPLYADAQTQARRWNGSRLDRDAVLRERVLGQLKAGWSPEQIAGRFRRDGMMRLSHESIYRFVHAQIRRHHDFTWRNYLPRAKSRRGWRARKGGSPALHMRHRVPLVQRPGEVLDRQTPGHWEADLMAFARYGQNLLFLHDRMSRVLIGSPLPSKRAEPVAGALAAVLQALPPACRKTVTFDNGTEFARHYELGAIGIDTYFCDPHAPWQKGGIENAIGRMRRFLPRKTDLSTLDSGALFGMMAAYNNTPRKCLDYRTPAEAFSQQVLHFKCESTSSPSRG
jgi:IS30 family transposase